jgi:CPA2 family monovalent cation:H+ antiporter-2
MEHSATEALTGIATVALAALVCGLVMTRLRQPAIVGYILAGVLLGPAGLGLVGDRGQIHHLAELGVLMLLFLVGIELSLRAFRTVWKLALGVTAIQIGTGVGIMLVCARLFGWSLPMALLLGFVVALSSTAVAVKILEDMGELRTRTGRITVGVLIAQDLAVVPMMLTINALSGGTIDWLVVPKVLLSVAFLVALILYLSRGRKIQLPFLSLVAGDMDLKPLAALAFCFGVSAVSGLLGLSAAYGAFLAGLVIGNSAERHEMVAVTQPIQSILLMVFFLSIGLLLDLDYIWDHMWEVLFLFFLAGVMLAQIGEFSFLLAGVGAGSGVIGEAERRLIVAVTVLSLALSPLWVLTARRLQKLAHDGVTESRELLRMVYAPEAEAIHEAASGALTGAQRQRRLAALWIRRHRLKRKRARASHDAAEAKPDARPATDAEVLPPEKPAAPAPEAAAPTVIDAEPAPEPKSKPKLKSKAKPRSKPAAKPAAKRKPAAKSAPKRKPAAPKSDA